MEDLKWPCWLKINPLGLTSADGEGLGKGTSELSFFKADDDDCSWLLRPSQRSWPGGLTNQDKVASVWGLQAMFPSIFHNCKIKLIAMVAVCETLTACPACCQARYSMSIVISVQFSLSCVWLFATPWTAAHQASLSITNSQSVLKFMFIKSVMPSNHLILCHPLLLPPSIFPSIRVFSSESVLPIRWPKYWSFSFSTSPSNEYSGLTSFGIDWFDLLVVQGTLKSLLQHHSPYI